MGSVHETGGAARNGARSGGAVAESLPDRFLTDQEAAKLLNLPATWIGEAARQKRLPHRMFGRYRRFDRDELLEWAERQKVGA